MNYLIGALAVSLVSGLVALNLDKRDRDALITVLSAFLLGPGLLLYLFVTRRAPRLQRVSPKAVARFMEAASAQRKPTWVLSYRGRGVMFIRRSDGNRNYYRNDVSNKIAEVRK